MPLFQSLQDGAAPGNYLPIKTKLDDMQHCSSILESSLKYIVEDDETFGLLTIDTYLENAPELVKQMQRISILLDESVQDLMFDHEMFDIVDARNLASLIYIFLASHGQVIDTLATQSKTLKTTGPLFDSVSRCLNKEQNALNRFRAAIEDKCDALRVSTEADWTRFNKSMDAATRLYPWTSPIPSDGVLNE